MGTQNVSPYQQVIERTKSSGTCAHKLLERLRWEKSIDTELVSHIYIYIYIIGLFSYLLISNNNTNGYYYYIE